MSAASNNDVLVVFMPSGKRGRFPRFTPILDAARSLGVDIDSVCGGRAICGRCQIEVVQGEFAKHGIVSGLDSVSPAGETEQQYRLQRGLADDRRLSCQAMLESDVVIDVPASSQVHRQVVRKPCEVHDITINPVVHAFLVEVAEPHLREADGDLQRLLAALQDEWQLQNLSCELHVIQMLQNALRGSGRQVTVAVRKNRRIVAVWPGFKERLFGIAVDVGSTTIAAQLCDLASGDVLASAGRMNPQIRFGEDLMSRVSYIMMNEGGEKDLITAVRNAINELIVEVTGEAGREAADVMEMTIVGNPIMQHLVLGISPVELGTAPFALATASSVEVLASSIDIAINPGGYVYALPCIAGHVGADAAGVMLAEAPHERDEVSLIVDLGTNAEIILGNRQRLLAASCPTGPAFEGAQISSGQRAAPGAIERVRINRDSLEAKFKVIGCDLWSDDPKFEEQTRSTGVTGICGSGIIEAIAEMVLSGIVDQTGRIKAVQASPRVVADGRTFAYTLHAGEPDIRILQTDVRAIQLAKAALYASIQLLMEHLGVARVDRIRLAGAFGAHIDVRYAMVLGLIPNCKLAQVSSAGNAAGTGARIALLDIQSREQIESQVRSVEKIEAAVEQKFQEYFVAAMPIPHETDVFEKSALADAVREAYMEIFPTASVESKLDVLAPGSYVAVTCSPSKGVDETLDISERLASRGFKVVPHVAAKMVKDAAHLREIMARLDDMPVTSIFVPGGDATKAAGAYSTALELLRAIAEFDHRFTEIGVAAHPEGHRAVSNDELMEQLVKKQAVANYLVTQMCFDADMLGSWIRDIREYGVTLPVWLGLPGALQRSELVKTSLRIGVGDSLRYLKNRANAASQLLKSKMYRPDDLLIGLAPYLADPFYDIRGYHIFCFNQVEKTQQWREEFLAEIDP